MGFGKQTRGTDGSVLGRRLDEAVAKGDYAATVTARINLTRAGTRRASEQHAAQRDAWLNPGR